MGCDYNKIREDNIREYGQGTRHLDIYKEQYSDRTHFIFELLQNAEDAGSGKVLFNLRKDRLEICNDGRPFDEADVRGICGIRMGKKEGDLTKIGQFGMGFKSVYVYTESPEIHSGGEHFKVENFVRPYEIDKRFPEDSYSTLFVLPFLQNSETSKGRGLKEIGDRLSTLNPRTLLFLRNINEFGWTVERGPKGTYIREVQDDGSVRRITVLAERKGDLVQEEWLVFDRSLGADYPENVRVEVAFLLARDGKTKEESVVACESSPLVVYFPTEKETNLGFLVQGPFKTTPARDNIPQDDEWNQLLIQEIAALVVESLERLRDMNLLTVSLLETLPLRPSNFPEDSMFRPLYDVVREALRSKRLWPTATNDYAAINSSKLARGAELVKLIDSEQLGILFGIPSEARWLSTEITENRTPDLYHYLVGKRGSYFNVRPEIEPLVPELEVRIEDILDLIDDDYMERQSDAWVTRFYSYLSDARVEQRVINIIKRIPIIRLEDGSNVCAFKHNGDPNAFLPTEEESDFPTVKREIAKKKALEFLVKIGLTEPDVVDEVLDKILPRYDGAEIDDISDSRHKKDIAKIFRALKTDSESKKERLIEHLKETDFLKSVNVVSGDIEFQRPEVLYFRSKELELYFEGNEDKWFLDECYTKHKAQLKELGVDEMVFIRSEKANSSGYVVARSWHGNHVRGLEGFDPDAQIDGLEFALMNPTLEKSAYVWNELLINNAGNVKGVVQRATRQTYENAIEKEEFSDFGKAAVSHKWVPDKGGAFHKPIELSLDDLHPMLSRDEYLARQLEMKTPIVSSAAEELGVDREDLEMLKNNPRAFKQFRKWLVQQEKKKKSEEDSKKKIIDGYGKKVPYKAAIDHVFSRPAKSTGMDENDIPPGPVPDPQKRRETVGKEIEAAASEVRKLSFKTAPVWEKKNQETREDLEMFYEGSCQICGRVNSFNKRDGLPYFEAVYLISYKEWLDHVGNVLCLCANCSAKFQHGSVEADNFVEQVENLRAVMEGGKQSGEINIRLCGSQAKLRYVERHFIALQELLKYEPDGTD